MILSQLLLAITLSQGAILSEEVVSEEEIEKESVKDRIKERRVNRDIKGRDYIFAKEAIFGLSASYISLSGDDASYLVLLDDISASGYFASVKPFAGYFYRNNRAIGVRFGYSKAKAQVDSATIDLGEINDLSFDIPYISYYNTSYSYGVFHRAYASIDRTGHIGLFAEVELSMSTATNRFEYENGDEINSIKSNRKSIGISFNPGVSAFVMHNLSATLSFEFGGFSYTRIDQYDANGVFVGSRDASKMRFMFNVFAINFGMNYHIW